MTKRYILLLALLLSANVLFAQSKSKMKGAIGYFRAGYNMVDFKDINTVMLSNGLPQPSSLAFNTGGGGFVIIKNILLGGEGWGFASHTSNGNHYTTTIDGGSGEFQAGYVAFHVGKMFLAPILGIGRYNYRMTINHDLSSNNFNVILANPDNSVQLNESGMAATARLLFNIKISKGTYLGVDAGYNYSFTPGDWNLFDNALSSGPKTTLTGAFVGLRIGGGFVAN